MKRTFRKLHLWLGIPLGLIISIICISGAILVFQTEISESAHRERYFVSGSISGERLPLNELIPIVNSQLTDNSVRNVRVESNPNRNYQVGLSEGFRAVAFVNPYTGEIVEIVESGTGFFSVMMRLHRWLLDGSRTVGKQIVGYTTLLFIVIIVTGIAVWWPKRRVDIAKKLKINTKYGRSRMWWELHTAGGMWVMLGLLTLALTGLTFSFRWYSVPFYKLFGVEARPGGGHGSANARPAGGGSGGNSERGDQKDPEVSYISWQKALETIISENEDFQHISVQDGSASVRQNQFWGNVRAVDRYSFDKATGSITERTLYADSDRSTRVRGWIFTIHVGAWGGWFSKLLTLFVALMGASLPITGYYMFWKKHLSKRRAK